MLTALYAAPSTTTPYYAWHYLNRVAPGEVRVPCCRRGGEGKRGGKGEGKAGKGGGVFNRGLLLHSFLNQKTPGVSPAA